MKNSEKPLDNRIHKTTARLIQHFVFVLIWVTSVFCFSPAFADDVSDRADKIKIAYLFHFSQFTEWETKPPVFNYCVYENEPFSQLLKQAYAGKKLGESQIAVQTVNAQSNFEACQLIYFPNSVSTDLLIRLNKKSILTVVEQKNNLEQSIVYLFEDNQKIRFFINNAAALTAGLKINSQLLSLSKEPHS